MRRYRIRLLEFIIGMADDQKAAGSAALRLDVHLLHQMIIVGVSRTIIVTHDHHDHKQPPAGEAPPPAFP
jgi:hypothetical protein